MISLSPRAAADLVPGGSGTEPGQPVVVHLRRSATVPEPLRVLLLHGLASGSYVWEAFVPRASGRCELWTADLPWRGDGVAGWAEHAGVSRWVAEAMAAIPGGPDVVVAHSFSANTLLEVLAGEAADHLEAGLRPRGVVLASPFYRPHAQDFDWDAIAYYLNDFHRILADGIRVRSGGRLASDIQQEIALHVRERVGPYGWVRFFDTYLRTPRLRLERVDMPCLILAGTEDFAAFPSDSEALAARLPDARLRILPGCGHFAMAECADVFAALVNDLLETVVARPRPGLPNHRTGENHA